MEQHAQFSPSKLPRIITCPASAFAGGEGDPAASNAYADAGTRLHLITAECLDQQAYQVPYFIRKKYNMDQEDIDVVEDCLNFVFNLKVTYPAEDAYELVETKVSLSEFIEITACDELADVYGTLDYALVVPSKRKLFVVDWKFGQGVKVYANSHQLSAYALATAKSYKGLQRFDEIHKVIFQPKISTDPEVEVDSPASLMKWLRETLAPALLATRAKHPKFNPDVDTCRWCPIKATCAARREKVKEVAADIFAAHGTLPNPNDEEIAKLLDKAPILESYLADIRLHVMHKIGKGHVFPGYKLVPGRSSRNWVDEHAALDWLSMVGLKEDDVYTKKFISPAQAEKKVGKHWKSDPDFLNLIDKKEGKPTLVKNDDPREALTFQSATEIFKEFTNE